MKGRPPGTGDFDRWRALYATMTDAERREWDAMCYGHWPEQAHGSVEAIHESVAEVIQATAPRLIDPPRRVFVLEVGGWRGDHAGEVLRREPSIGQWWNVEFCREAAASPKTEDARYVVTSPERFRWWEDGPVVGRDIGILSHVVEHLSEPDLRGLISAIRAIPVVHVEAPLTEDGHGWEGYLGTHMLTVGWKGVDAIFKENGYSVEKVGDMVRRYRRSA